MELLADNTDTRVFGLLGSLVLGVRQEQEVPVEGGVLAFPYLPRSVFLSTCW